MKTKAGLAVVLAAAFMGQVDGFVVTVASPVIQRELPASFGQVQLIGAAYVIAAAAGLITGARLGDRYGRRRVFLVGVAGFTAASAVCGLAPTAELLIAARFAQGAAASLLLPQLLALIRSMFLDETERARAIGWYGVVIGLGVISGLAGGGLVTRLDWRLAFLINVPVGVVILALGPKVIAETDRGLTRLDPTGAGLTVLALPALVAPLVLGAESGGAVWPWLSVLLGALTLAVLAVQQRKSSSPLFPPRVVTAPGTRTGLLAIMAFFGGNAGLFFVFTFHTQAALGVEPFAAGLMFVPLGIGFAVGSWWGGRLAPRLGGRLPVLGCLGLATALSAHLLVGQLVPHAQHVLLAVAIGLTGLAQGLVVSSLVTSLFGRVSVADAGTVSGLAATATQVGLATGYAAVGAWYRLVLGAAPGQAYSAAMAVLIVLALGTAALCHRRR
ncbi:MFS transporter [Allokutzneria sp. A3M-2-11 16]|uniref:MFS transporter n=1 Tax=Allokutzneria sp. A3M-2-11 16 TaxID=2962043 RepID=UPI0020B8A224|nr:MFS transporter [Allokutzneria sp. A3M-2-11 16]MCP3804811.1 MFS transporter [Allokutzneria sp. A3M-2-11 16]